MASSARSVCLLVCLVFATTVLAHEGKTHVMGTISAVDAQHVVVTDREGKTRSIALTKDTKFEQADAPATASALTVGARVVIDVTGKPESFTATEVRLAPADFSEHHRPPEP